MSYCEAPDLSGILPEEDLLKLADDDGAGSLSDERVQAVIVEAIAQADAEIDSYLGLSMTVPLEAVPAPVKKMSAKMAVYHLYSRLGRVPRVWERIYEGCVKSLEKMAEGKIMLAPDVQGGVGRVMHRTPGRFFSANSLTY